MIRTKLTEMLGIEYPIVQGCMQWISRAPLVAAVSEAGGLGLLSSSTFSSADELQAEIRKIKSMTSKPFAVNLTLMPSLVVPDYAGYIRVCAEEGVKVMETAGRPPKDDMVRAIKDAGMVLIHKCTTVKHALKAQSLGADMVVADGFECAGADDRNVKRVFAKEQAGCEFKDVAEDMAGKTACKMFFENADVENCGVICCGQTSGLIHDVLPVQTIIGQMMHECEATIAKFA